jgi:hypothetical protein
MALSMPVCYSRGMQMQSDCDNRAVRTVASTLPVPRRGSSFWAPCLSGLCFVHCTFTALLVPWVPALASVAEVPRLERALLAVSVLTAGWVLRRLRPAPWGWLTIAGAAACVAWGLVQGQERPKQAGFLAIAAIQTGLTFWGRRGAPPEGCCGPEVGGGGCGA